jgi:hypothetical protein
MEVYVGGLQMKRPILRPVGYATSQLAAVLLFVGVAQADTRCSVPMIDWQPRDAVVRLAEQNGWKVRRIKIDDGCYEVVGTDAKGRKFEVKVHPGTLAVVEYEYGDDEEEEDYERKDKD